MLTYIQTALNGGRSGGRATRKGARERVCRKAVMVKVMWGQPNALEKTDARNRSIILADICIVRAEDVSSA